ncbi:MAG: TRAP transporter small permease [Thermodesulfobacteriota bacterium]
MKHFLETFVRMARRVEDGALIALFLSMMLMAVAQILLRNLFSSGIVWGDSFVSMMVLWTALFGAMVASRDDSHIRVEVASRFLPERVRRLVAGLTSWFAAAVCGFLCYASGVFLASEYEDGLAAVGSVPSWVFAVILPAAFGIMAFRHFAHGVSNFLSVPRAVS